MYILYNRAQCMLTQHPRLLQIHAPNRESRVRQAMRRIRYSVFPPSRFFRIRARKYESIRPPCAPLPGRQAYHGSFHSHRNRIIYDIPSNRNIPSCRPPYTSEQQLHGNSENVPLRGLSLSRYNRMQNDGYNLCAYFPLFRMWERCR